MDRDSARHTARIKAACVKLLYTHATTGFFASVINAGIILGILWEVVPHFSGMTQLLLNSGLSEKQARFAKTIRHSGETLPGVINDILDFTQEQLSVMLTKWLSRSSKQPLLSTIETNAYVHAAFSSTL
jgi:hypothetical protein